MHEIWVKSRVLWLNMQNLYTQYAFAWAVGIKWPPRTLVTEY